MSIVDFATFKRRITREVKASPAKAAALASLLLVGCYFWLPLLWTWSPSKAAHSDDDGKAHVSALIAQSTQPLPVSSSQAIDRFDDWQQIAEDIKNDPRTRPANELHTLRNPFGGTAPRADLAEQVPTPDLLTPESLGLTLNSVIIGPQRRTALINGEVFSEGSWIEVAEGVAYVVRRVRSHAVELERNGQVLQLELAVDDGALQIERSAGGWQLKPARSASSRNVLPPQATSAP